MFRWLPKTEERCAGHTLARNGRVVWPSRAFFDEHCQALQLTLQDAQAAVAAKVSTVTRADPTLAWCCIYGVFGSVQVVL